MVKHKEENQSQEDRPLRQEPEEPESPEEERHLEKLLLSLEDKPDLWTDGQSLHSHLRHFRSREEYKLVRGTHRQLQHSGYYWGAIGMTDAHRTLAEASVGTFLIRDSTQPNVFFTLSYRSADAPTSARILVDDLRFRLSGSKKSFSSLFALLAHYTSGSCKLTTPFRRERPECLKGMCRRVLLKTYGAPTLRTFPGLSGDVKDYISVYPHAI